MLTTSRTGTARYRRWRKRVLMRALDSGVRQCPACGVVLDYSRGLTPSSAEPDHVLPVRWGGTDTVGNGQVLCRRCNQSKGDGRRPRRRVSSVVTVDFSW